MIHNYEDTNDELLPCPFCGEKPIWWLKGNPDLMGRKRVITIKCPNCRTTQETGVLTLSTEAGCELAVEKWNKRTNG